MVMIRRNLIRDALQVWEAGNIPQATQLKNRLAGIEPRLSSKGLLYGLYIAHETECLKRLKILDQRGDQIARLVLGILDPTRAKPSTQAEKEPVWTRIRLRPLIKESNSTYTLNLGGKRLRVTVREIALLVDELKRDGVPVTYYTGAIFYLDRTEALLNKVEQPLI
jgi:hypothetical protein